MNQFFAAGTAFLLAGILWSLGRKPKFFGKTNIHSAGSIPPISLSINKKENDFGFKAFRQQSESSISLPFSSVEKINLRKKLFSLIRLGPVERLKAVSIASDWGDPSILPILKTGLRDSDSQVVLIAAEGIQKFKNSSRAENIQNKDRPPRNVFLMR